MSQPARSLWGNVIKNFLNSFKPRQISGKLQGTDYFGNKYYEILSNSRRPRRWFVPPKESDFQQELPAEWEGWLRGRRGLAPTKDEVDRNLALMQLKMKNAIKVEAKAGKKVPLTKGMETFPLRPEYELLPGQGPRSFKK